MPCYRATGQRETEEAEDRPIRNTETVECNKRGERVRDRAREMDRRRDKGRD